MLSSGIFYTVVVISAMLLLSLGWRAVAIQCGVVLVALAVSSAALTGLSEFAIDNTTLLFTARLGPTALILCAAALFSGPRDLAFHPIAMVLSLDAIHVLTRGAAPPFTAFLQAEIMAYLAVSFLPLLVSLIGLVPRPAQSQQHSLIK